MGSSRSGLQGSWWLNTPSVRNPSWPSPTPINFVQLFRQQLGAQRSCQVAHLRPAPLILKRDLAEYDHLYGVEVLPCNH